VQRCIVKLPEIYGTVLVLRDVEEIGTDDVAGMLGTSVGVVKTRLHRARQALRTLLDPHFREGEP
jgi:RNA polymerase sigma-70 factor (ECF subfamily)